MYHVNALVNLEYLVLQFLHVLALFGLEAFSCLNRKSSFILVWVFFLIYLMEGK